MIPKTIHYCWFGGNEKPKTVIKCINSWKKYCPNYDIIEWNDNNIDISLCPTYVQQAYERHKWAFVTDYVRLKVVYENGGIYFDTDVELIKKIDFLLNNRAFFGFENANYIATGLGFGAEKGLDILREMMNEYKDIVFIMKDGSLNQETCPSINTRTFVKHGLIKNNKMQYLDDGILILPSIYMCPIDYETGKYTKSLKTISIHWFDSSWMSDDDRNYHEQHKKALRNAKIDYWKHYPNRVLIRLLGQKQYDSIKRRIKCGHDKG